MSSPVNPEGASGFVDQEMLDALWPNGVPPTEGAPLRSRSGNLVERVMSGATTVLDSSNLSQSGLSQFSVESEAEEGSSHRHSPTCASRLEAASPDMRQTGGASVESPNLLPSSEGALSAKRTQERRPNKLEERNPGVRGRGLTGIFDALGNEGLDPNRAFLVASSTLGKMGGDESNFRGLMAAPLPSPVPSPERVPLGLNALDSHDYDFVPRQHQTPFSFCESDTNPAHLESRLQVLKPGTRVLQITQSACKVTQELGNLLAAYLVDVDHLEFVGVERVSDCALDSLAQFAPRQLSLRGCNLTQKNIEQLMAYTDVEHLVLSECRLMGETAPQSLGRVIQEMSSLQSLDLQGVMVTDALADAILRSKSLTSINLHHCHFHSSNAIEFIKSRIQLVQI